MRRRLRLLVHNWIDRRGYIPNWACWVWPYAHWCPGMDDLLILGNITDCFCEHIPEHLKVQARREEQKLYDHINKDRLF